MRKFYTSIDLGGQPIRNFVFENLAVAPAAGNPGRPYFDTNTLSMMLDNGSEFVPIGGVPSWADITDKPATFTPAAHAHGIGDVTGLQTALDDKSGVNHTHAISGVTGLQAALDAKSNTGHGHTIADVSGLQAAIDGKSDTGHTHVASEITDFATAVNTQVVAYWDSIAGTDADVDTIREVLDLILQNASDLTDQIGRFNADIGDGTSTSIAVAHSLNSLDVTVEVYDKASGDTVVADVTRTNANTVTIATSAPLAENECRVVIKK